MKRREAVKSLGASGLIGLAGCLSEGGISGGDGINQISIAMTAYPFLPYTLAYHVGREQGFYDEQGLEVSVESFGNPSDASRALTSGSLDFASMGATTMAKAWAAGAGISIVSGVTMAAADVVYYVRADSDIEQIQDLVGKTVSWTSPGSITHQVVHTSIEMAEGISMDDVQGEATGGPGETLSATENGVVDLGWGVIPPAFLWEEQDRIRILFFGNEYVPNFQENVTVVSNRFAEENGDSVRAFNQGTIDAIDFIVNQPDEAAQLYAEPNDWDADTSIKMWDNLTIDEFYSASLPRKSLEVAEQAAITTGVLEDEVEWNDLVNQQYLPEDYRTEL